MEQIRIEKPGADVAQLADELFAAFPAWRHPSTASPGATQTAVTVCAEGDVLVLTVPCEDVAAVREIVARHALRPRDSQPPATAAAVLAALATMPLAEVATLDDLKEAIRPVCEAAEAVVRTERPQPDAPTGQG